MFSAALPEDDSRARLHALFTGRQVSVRKRGCGVKGEAGAREEKAGQTDGWKSGCTQRRPTGVKIETRELGAAVRRRQVAFCWGGGLYDHEANNRLSAVADQDIFFHFGWFFG